MKSRNLYRSLRDTLPIVTAHPETKSWFIKRLFELSPRFETWLVEEESGALATESTLDLILKLMHLISQHKEVVESEEVGEVRSVLLPEHYGYLNKALIHTLHDILGADFTDQVKEAWGTALNEIAVILMENQETRVSSDRLEK